MDTGALSEPRTEHGSNTDGRRAESVPLRGCGGANDPYLPMAGTHIPFRETPATTTVLWIRRFGHPWLLKFNSDESQAAQIHRAGSAHVHLFQRGRIHQIVASFDS
jgi:hypothetical protein